MKLLLWWRTLRRIVREYDLQRARTDADLRSVRNTALAAEATIRERTDVHVDVSCHLSEPHTVIVCGRYHNRDFVKVYTLPNDGFQALVHQLEREELRYGKLNRTDAPRVLRFLIDREVNRRDYL